jgi:hypothetical protein
MPRRRALTTAQLDELFALWPGELIPAEALRCVADQVDATPEALATYATRFQTRYEQLDALRTDFGFADVTPQHRREILVWLLPVALATTSAATIAATLMDEVRRRRLIVPGPASCCARFTKAAAGNGRAVCPRAFSGRFGAKPC